MELSDLDYDYEDGVQPDVVEPPVDEEKSALEMYLNHQGISDIHKIKFEDEDGMDSEKDWNDLSKDEQFNILMTGSQSPELDLDDDEIGLINDIRQSRLTPKQYLEQLRPNQPVVEQPSYVVDDLTDDELYMADLQTRIKDITDEQLQNALTKAKEDEDLFKKQVAGIREEYKQIEEEKRLMEQEQQQEQLNQQYEAFSNNIINEIANLKNIGELDVAMDNDDMNELASFILDRDDTGTSYFAKALNNPNELVRMAWFTLHGDEIFNSISDYYKNLIKQVAKTNYQKGLEDGKKAPNVVISRNAQQNINSLNDITY